MPRGIVPKARVSEMKSTLSEQEKRQIDAMKKLAADREAYAKANKGNYPTNEQLTKWINKKK